MFLKSIFAVALTLSFTVTAAPTDIETFLNMVELWRTA
jgi:hypothetical protein